MGTDVITKAIIIFEILLAIIEHFPACYLNLTSGGDPNYVCESYIRRVWRGKDMVHIFENKCVLQLQTHCFISYEVG
jgi:hypothetical protein